MDDQQDPEDIRQTAAEILSRAEYQPEPQSLLDRALGWINDRFEDLLGSLFGSGGSYLFGWVILAVSVALVLWLLWKVMPRQFHRVTADEVRLESEQQTRAGRDEWLRQAALAEEAGNFAEAVRARYRATVAALMDRQEVDDREGATSGEYRASFAAPPVRRELFGAVTDRFEEVWYGGDAASSGDVELLRRLDGPVTRDES